jgi:hypothetical protein
MKYRIKKPKDPLPVRIVEIEDLGSVTLAKSHRARRLSMTVKPQKGIRVAIPYRTSFKNAMEFLEANLPWAKENLQRVREIERRHSEIQNALPPINRTHARRLLVSRLDELAAQHGFTYNRVFVRNQKTLWGSCSHVNNINLNVNLVRLPPELTDYVILHELVHTRVKNHSKRFWSQLDRFVGNAKAMDKQLRKHSLGLSLH